METGPPKLIEAIVGRLIPSASREAIVGDLRERYASLPAYLRDASGAVPAVLWGRIRRTADRLLVAAEAYTLFLVFRPQRFQPDATGGLRIAGPIATALAVFALLDAYRAPEPRADRNPTRSSSAAFDASLMRGVTASALAMIAVCACEAMLSVGLGALALPRPDLATGVLGGFLMLLPLRVAWDQVFTHEGYGRIVLPGGWDHALPLDRRRRLLERRRRILRRSWLWYMAFLVPVKLFGVIPRELRPDVTPWPIVVEAVSTLAAILILRSLASRLAGRVQCELARLDEPDPPA